MTNNLKPLHIEIRNLSLSFDGKGRSINVLNNIDLQVEEGESIGLVGSSGSGKTSLLMITAGLEKPTSGSVRVFDKDIVNMNENKITELRGKNIGIVFQSFHLIPTLTAYDNVALPLEINGNKVNKEIVNKELKQVGLIQRKDHYPTEMSGGEQQRIALARALIGQPKILLADEPTGNLDTKTGQKIIDLLFKLQKERKITMIIATHDENLAKHCNKIIEIDAGKFI